MPGCVLRIAGPEFEPGELAKNFPGSSVTSRGGLNIPVSECDGDDVRGQTIDAEAFLNQNEPMIRKVLSGSGVEASLDFGVWQNDSFAQSVSVPASLAEHAGRLGLAIEISLYASR